MRDNLCAGIKLLLRIPLLCVRWYRVRASKKIFIYLTILFLTIEYFTWRFLFSNRIPSPIKTRLYPQLPITNDFRSFQSCQPDAFKIDEIVRSFHRTYNKSSDEVCFLIEHLDGGPWWSYVSQEFAEILVQLKEYGQRSNIQYRSLPYPNDLNRKTDLRKYFLQACDINEEISKDDQPMIIVLFWDVNILPWSQMRNEWNDLFQTTRIQFSIFVDDLHFTDHTTFRHHQYVFESLATEIFSTYPYLFHNYYYNIPTDKLTWLAHSASRLSSTTLNQSAANRLFVSGANLPEWYPCRAFAFSLCPRYPNLVSCLKHPGYGINMKNDSSFYYGAKRYFSYMRQFIFGLATCESVHYAIAKSFEIPANGLVLVTTEESVAVLEHLGFRLNEDFLVVNCSSGLMLKENIEQLQTMSTKKIEQIRKQGQEKVHHRHLTTHRAALIHVRLLSQALFISTNKPKEKETWNQWGRICVDATP